MVLHSLVIWLLLFSYADADIKIISDEIAVECGSKCTLTCKTKPFTSSVAWMFQNDVIPIAKCNKRICNLIPKYVEHYEFTPDVEKGIFNLTIKKLTKSDIGRTFVCSKGDESASETIRLKDYKVLRLEDTENNKITATSGYISPDTNVMFKWTKIDADNQQESDYHPQLLYSSAKLFSDVFVCCTDQQIRHSMTIFAKSNISGSHYLKIAVTYGNGTVKSNITTLRYNTEEQQDPSNRKDSNDRNKSGMILTIISVVVFVILTIIGIKAYRRLLDCRRRRYMSSNDNRDKPISKIGMREPYQKKIAEEIRSILEDNDSGCGISLKSADSEEKIESILKLIKRKNDEEETDAQSFLIFRNTKCINDGKEICMS